MSKKKVPFPKINEESTIKVIILFLLDELKTPLSFQTLTEIILWDGSVNYFIFADCLDNLAQKGAVDKETVGKETLYSINSFGKDILENVSDLLKDSIKTQMLRSATRLLRTHPAIRRQEIFCAGAPADFQACFRYRSPADFPGSLPDSSALKRNHPEQQNFFRQTGHTFR